jgi:hypothetical protein
MPSSTLEQGIQVYLSAITTLKAIVGTRIYWIGAPDGATMPYITYRLISGDNLNAIVGTNKEQSATVQFSLWGENEFVLLNASNILINAIEGFSGSFDGRNVLFITTTGPRQMRDPDFTRVFHFVVDAEITFVR